MNDKVTVSGRQMSFIKNICDRIYLSTGKQFNPCDIISAMARVVSNIGRKNITVIRSEKSLEEEIVKEFQNYN